MPAKGQTDPTALPARITAWLTDHPGKHRARDVANGLGRPEDTTQSDWSLAVARALGRMVKTGAVVRELTDLGHKKPVGLYAAPAPQEEAQTSVALEECPWWSVPFRRRPAHMTDPCAGALEDTNAGVLCGTHAAAQAASTR